MNNYDTVTGKVASYVENNPHTWNGFLQKMNKALEGQYRAQRWLVMMTSRYLMTDPSLEQPLQEDEDFIQLPEYESVMEEYRRKRSLTLDLLTGNLTSPDMTVRDDGYQTSFTFSEERCKPLVRRINLHLSKCDYDIPPMDAEDLLVVFLSLPFFIANLVHHIEDMEDAHAMLFFHFLFRGGFGKLLCCVSESRKIPMLMDFITGALTEMMQEKEEADAMVEMPVHEVLMRKWSGLNGDNQPYVKFCYKLRRFVFDRSEEYETWHSGLMDNKEELYKLLGQNMSRLSQEMPTGLWGGMLGHHFLKMLDSSQPRDNTFETCHRLLESPMLADRLRKNIDQCDRHTMFMLYWMIFGNAFTEMARFISNEIIHDKAHGWQHLMGGEGVRSLVLTGLATRMNTKKDFIEARKEMTLHGRKAVVSTFEEFAGKPGNRMTCLLLEEMLVEKHRTTTLKAVASILDEYDSRQSSKKKSARPSVLLPCLLHVLMEKGLVVPEMLRKKDGDRKQRTYQTFIFAMAEKFPEKGFKVDKRASGLYAELQDGHTHYYFTREEEVREAITWLRKSLDDGLADN